MTHYETDFYAWVHEQTTLLQEGRLADLDTEHLIDVLEDQAWSVAHELYNRLILLLAHLLKLQVAARVLPGAYERAQRDWQLTCDEQRYRLDRLLRQSPSLRVTVPDEVADAYTVARVQCLAALGVDEAQVPDVCPWEPEPVLDPTFFPGEAPDGHRGV
jgi:hypothetical protein